VDTVVGRFERLWLEEGRPSLDAFIAGLSAKERRLALAELAHVDLEFRLKAGQDARVEEYLTRFPELDQPEIVRVLVATEYRHRRAREGELSLQGYAARFPHLVLDLDGVPGPTPTGVGGLSQVDEPAPASTPGRPAVPGYAILGELGCGGMGVVYRAHQVELDRVVALKIIRADEPDRTQRLRFLAEAQAAARLRHPNIVQVYQVGEHEGRPFVTLELVEGGTLAQRLARQPLAAREAAGLVEILARAVQHAHEQGIVHRDLKPANVLLTADGTPKVADFGLAKRMGEAGQTQSGAIVGTPSYMAPEQAAGKGKEVGPAADVYALGAILYEALVGRPPFRGDTSLETLRQVLDDEPVPPRRLQPKVPRDLETICLKCLQKEPGRRYASARDLADDLHRFLGGLLIQARTPSAWRRAVAWARRHRVTAALLVSGVVLMATVLGGLLWHTAQLTRERNVTEQKRLEAVRNEHRAREAEHASRLRLADQSFRQGDRFVLAGLLDQSRPASPEEEDLRGFEWWRLTGFRHPPWRLCSLQGSRPEWLQYSPDGRWLAVGLGNPSRVEVRDATTGKPHFQAPRQFLARSAVFGPAGSGWLATASGTEVTRWDLQTGKSLGVLVKSDRQVYALAVYPDGRLLLGAPGEIMMWTPDKGSCPAPLSGYPCNAIGLSVNPNGKSLAADCAEKGAAVWDLQTGKQRVETPTFDNAVASSVYSSRGSFLAHHRRDGSVQLLHDQNMEPLLNDFVRMPAGSTALAFSPDEQTLVTGGPEGLVRFWDIPSRTFRAQLRWQSHGVGCLAFSPDGATLAVGTADGAIYQVETALRPDEERLRARLGRATCAAWSPDGKMLAVAYSGRTIQLIDARTGTVRRELQGLPNPVTDVAFAPDGGTLAARSRGYRLYLWDAATGAPRPSFREPVYCMSFAPKGCLLALGGWGQWGIHFVDGSGTERGAIPIDTGVGAVAFSPDGRTLATSSRGNVEIWDLSKGLSPKVNLAQVVLDCDADCLTFLPDGTLAVGDRKGRVHFLKPSGDKLVSVRQPLQCSGPITDLVVLPDGRTLLSNVPSDKLRLWDLRSFQWKAEWWFACRAWPSPDGGTLATCSSHGVLQLTDLRTWTMRLLGGQPLWAVYGLAITPDGQELITASDAPKLRAREKRPVVGMTETVALQDPTASLRFWGLADGCERPGLRGPLNMAPPDRLALSPDRRTLAAGAVDGSIHVWDRSSGSLRKRLFVSRKAQHYTLSAELARALVAMSPEYPEAVCGLAFSPDGALLAAAGSLGVATVWEVAGWQEVQSLQLDPGGPSWVAFAPDGALVVPQGGRVRFLNARDGSELRVLGNADDSPALGAAFTVRGDRMAVHHQRRLIRLWDLAQGTAVDLHGHLDEVSALAFTPDGRILGSASHDRTVKLWSVAAGAEVASLEGHTGRIHCLVFSPDGRVLVSGGEDEGGRGEVLLWRAPRP
jgi:WD40 repeat protein